MRTSVPYPRLWPTCIIFFLCVFHCTDRMAYLCQANCARLLFLQENVLICTVASTHERPLRKFPFFELSDMIITLCLWRVMFGDVVFQTWRLSVADRRSPGVPILAWHLWLEIATSEVREMAQSINFFRWKHKTRVGPPRIATHSRE